MIGNEIREALRKTCAALNNHQVEYMVIGGVAVGFYGYQRPSSISYHQIEPTPDIDFWYNPSIKNYHNLLKALKDLGTDTSRLEQEIFDRDKTYLRIQNPTFKCEFLPRLEGLESFDKCRLHATDVEYDGNRIKIIGYSDLLKNKEAVARDVDKTDIAELRRRNKKRGL